MSLTRREFAFASTSIALTVLGCDGEASNTRLSEAAPQQGGPASGPGEGGKGKNRANLATEPFRVGSPDQYKQAKLYADYKADKGVWLVSDGKALVALSATCTHNGCTTHYLDDKQIFDCPCHHSHFSLEGDNLEGKAKRPLERCALKLVKTDTGQEIEVDPTRRFRKDKDQWGDPASSLTL
jgi:Rieske Fe-S protein